MSDAIVLGANGMLGRALVDVLTERNVPFRAYGREDFDLLAPRSELLEGASVVYNAAAYTAVDQAETDEENALALNGNAVGELARLCGQVGAKLVHVSTDYVFDGEASSPYGVDHPIAPCNAYGRTKAAGEQALRDALEDHLIVRTSWLFAPWGNNFVRTMARLGSERDALNVVNDQRGRPTCCIDLATALVALVDAGAMGTFHVANRGEATWYDLAREAIAVSGAVCEVSPCTTEAFPRPAHRPPYSVLDTTATEALIGDLPHWRPAVARALRAS